MYLVPRSPWESLEQKTKLHALNYSTSINWCRRENKKNKNKDVDYKPKPWAGRIPVSARFHVLHAPRGDTFSIAASSTPNFGIQRQNKMPLVRVVSHAIALRCHVVALPPLAPSFCCDSNKSLRLHLFVPASLYVSEFRHLISRGMTLG